MVKSNIDYKTRKGADGLIDIHCHILPGVDDGADDLNMALAMARGAVAEGITHICATPHQGNGRYETSPQKVIELVSNLNNRLLEAGIPLTILPGQEVHTYHNWLDDLLDGKLLRLNDSRYLLLELNSQFIEKHQDPTTIDALMHELEIVNCVPIIAHPERYRSFHKNPKLLDLWLHRGALSQVTSHSINGSFGKSIQAFTRKLILSGSVHMIASDAHHSESRPVTIQSAYDCVARWTSLEVVRWIKNNVTLIINDKELDTKIPKFRKKLWCFF
jgi:protein-tyrosine phosphatase